MKITTLPTAEYFFNPLATTSHFYSCLLRVISSWWINAFLSFYVQFGSHISCVHAPLGVFDMQEKHKSDINPTRHIVNK